MILSAVLILAWVLLVALLTLLLLSCLRRG